LTQRWLKRNEKYVKKIKKQAAKSKKEQDSENEK